MKLKVLFCFVLLCACAFGQSNPGGGGSSLQVAGSGFAVGDTINFNATTPVAGTNGLNITFQTSNSGTTDSVSAEVVGDGTSTHYLSGTGVYSTPSGLPAGVTFASPTLTISSAGNGNGAVALSGNTSGTATFTAPAVAGTIANAVVSSNALAAPPGSGSAPAYAFSDQLTTGIAECATQQPCVVINGNPRYRFVASQAVADPAMAVGWSGTSNANGTMDTAFSRAAAGLAAMGTGAANSVAGFVKSAMTAAITTADVTCGTGGTISSCVAATTITGLTFTLPLFATNWAMDCDLVVGQATAATANQWLIQTATNGVTNTTASYTMATAATAMAVGAVTDQASTTTAFQIAPSWTLGGTATKMPVHIHAMFEGVSVSGTVINLQVIAPTVGDLLTIYRGASCSLHP